MEYCRFTPSNYNEMLGLPTKFGKEECMPTERFERECDRFPMTWDRTMPMPFDRTMPTTWDRTMPMTWDRTMPMTWDRTMPMTWDRTMPMTWDRTMPMTWDRYERFPWMSRFPMTWDRSCYERTPMTWDRSCYERTPMTWDRFGNERTFPMVDRWMMNNTLCNTPFRPSSEAEYYTLRNPIRCYDRETRGLWLCFDLRGFKPEECCVTLDRKERCIVVEACHEVKDVKEHCVSRKFVRKFYLPEYMSKMDLSKIELHCFFAPDGFFYIEGVLPTCTWENFPTPCMYPFFGGWRDNTCHWIKAWEHRPVTCWKDTTCRFFPVNCKYI